MINDSKFDINEYENDILILCKYIPIARKTGW